MGTSSKKISSSDELGEITDEIKKIIKTTSVDLLRELIKGSPKKTGNFQRGWTITPTKPDDMGFLISNPVSYGYILWNGRQKHNGRWYGSELGWGKNGGEEVLKKTAEKLQDRLDAVK